MMQLIHRLISKVTLGAPSNSEVSHRSFEKHGGQIKEGPSDLLLCIVDDTYGHPSEMEEQALLDAFESSIEREFGDIFVEVDVGPGYDIPAVATVVEFVSDYWPHMLAAFFAGKPIKDNMGVWLDAAKSIGRFLGRSDVVLGRNAATTLAIKAVFEYLGGVPKVIQCKGYYIRDVRIDDEEQEPIQIGEIQSAPLTEYLGVSQHVVRIEADGVSFEVIVDGKTANCRRV